MRVHTDSLTTAPSSPLRDGAAALAVPVTLLLIMLGPGTFGWGRGVWAQALGWLLLATWAVCGVGALRSLAGRTRLLAALGAGLLASVLLLQASAAATAAAAGAVRQSDLPWISLLPWSRLRVLVAVAVSPGVVAGLARCLRHALTRGRAGTLLTGCSCALLVLSGVAAAEAAQGGGRPAMPLGHHNLLALVVAPLTVVLVAALAGGGPRGGSPTQRWLLRTTAGAGVLMTVATGSLAGALGLVVGSAAALLWAARSRASGTPADGLPVDGRRRILLAALLLLSTLILAISVTQRERLADLVRGADSSAVARAAYARTAVDAFFQRPMFGWGLANGGQPLALLLPPRPAVVEPGQVVADAHSLWLDLLMELGVVGLVLLLLPVAAVVLPSARRCWRGVAEPVERAALAGWIALASMSLVAGWFDVGAVWWLGAVLLAAQLAGQQPSPGAQTAVSRPLLGLVALPVLLIALGVTPDLMARRGAETLDDPRSPTPPWVLRWGTPLDRLRAALREEDPGRVLSFSRSAASLADGQWLHWTLAGDLELRYGDRDRARAMFERACDLEPEVPFAALRLAELSEGSASTAALARALLAEPRLAAAAGLSSRRLGEAVGQLETLDGVALGWRAALVESLAVHREEFDPDERGAPEPLGALNLRIDDLPETSVSLFLERRRPVPLVVPMAELRLDAVGLWDIEPATRLLDTDPGIWRPGCALSGPH